MTDGRAETRHCDSFEDVAADHKTRTRSLEGGGEPLVALRVTEPSQNSSEERLPMSPVTENWTSIVSGSAHNVADML